jgi:ribosomal protein L11 methyltransferase
VKLGARHATAIDIDDVAARVTRENCTINGVLDYITVKKGVLADIESQKADIVVANIIADVVINLTPLMPSYLKEGGILLTSGIIKERKDDVIKAYTEAGFECMSLLEMGEWVAIVFKCPDSL